MSACEGRCALAPQMLEIFPLSVCLLVFCLIAESRRCRSLSLLSPLCIWSAAFVLQRWKKSLFIFYCLCPVLDMSFSHFQVNLKIHLTLHREQTEKCFLEGKNKVFWCWFLSPQRTLRKERRGETKKKFLSLLFLSKSRLSLGREWSACLIEELGRGSCRC